MSECKHDLTPNYQGYFCCICDIEFDQYEVIEQLKASEAECERLREENNLNVVALADWQKFGRYLINFLGQTLYIDMYNEALIIDEINISLTKEVENE